MGELTGKDREQTMLWSISKHIAFIAEDGKRDTKESGSHVADERIAARLQNDI